MMFSLSPSLSFVWRFVCDSFLDHGYSSLSFVKEREQRKLSVEAFPLPRSCPSPGSVELHPGIGYPMPPTAPEMWCCDIVCNAALTRRPSHCGCRLVFSPHARMRTACTVCAAATGVEEDSSACIRYAIFFICFSLFSQPRCFPCSYRFSPMQLFVCDSFLNYGYFSLSFVKEREQRKSSGEAFLLPGSCPSPGSVKPHPGIGYPMPP